MSYRGLGLAILTAVTLPWSCINAGIFGDIKSLDPAIRKIMNQGKRVGASRKFVRLKSSHFPERLTNPIFGGPGTLRIAPEVLEYADVWVDLARMRALEELGSSQYRSFLNPKLAEELIQLPDTETRLWTMQVFKAPTQPGFNLFVTINRLAGDPKHLSTFIPRLGESSAAKSYLLGDGFLAAGELRSATIEGGHRVLLFDNMSGTLAGASDFFGQTPLVNRALMRDIGYLSTGIFHHLTGRVPTVPAMLRGFP